MYYGLCIDATPSNYIGSSSSGDVIVVLLWVTTKGNTFKTYPDLFRRSFGEHAKGKYEPFRDHEKGKPIRLKAIWKKNQERDDRLYATKFKKSYLACSCENQS